MTTEVKSMLDTKVSQVEESEPSEPVLLVCTERPGASQRHCILHALHELKCHCHLSTLLLCIEDVRQLLGACVRATLGAGNRDNHHLVP
jgi:hypothetical protein